VVNYTGSGGNSATGISLQVGGTTGRAVLNLNSTGTFNLATVSGSSPSVGGNNGAVDTGAGAIYQSNDTVTVGRDQIYMQLGVGDITTYGSYVLSGGVLKNGTTAGFRVGCGGLGVFTQTGGTLTCNRWFAIGTSVANPTFSHGIATFTGGTASVATAYRILLADRTNQSGTLNIGTQAGGAAVVTSANTTASRCSIRSTPSAPPSISTAVPWFSAGRFIASAPTLPAPPR
jgi:hypothetical protein